MVAGSEHGWGLLAFELHRPSVNGVAEQAVFKRIGLVARFFSEGSGKEADNGVGHERRGHFAACHHEIPDAAPLVSQVCRPLIHAFVVPAEEDDARQTGEPPGIGLAERLTGGVGENDAGALGLKIVQSLTDEMRHEHHARASAKGAVVHGAVRPFGMGSRVGELKLSQASVHGPPGYAVQKGSLNLLGKEADKTDSHDAGHTTPALG